MKNSIWTIIGVVVFLPSIGMAFSEELPDIALDCPITHKFEPDTQTCKIWWNSIYVAGPLVVLAVSLVLLVPYMILKKKNIPTKRYMLVIIAGILIFFGISWIQNGIFTLTPENFEQTDSQIVLIGAFIPIGIGAVPLIFGIIALKKAKLGIRR